MGPRFSAGAPLLLCAGGNDVQPAHDNTRAPMVVSAGGATILCAAGSQNSIAVSLIVPPLV